MAHPERPPLCAALAIWEAWLSSLQERLSSAAVADDSVTFEVRHARAIIQCKKAALVEIQAPAGLG